MARPTTTTTTSDDDDDDLAQELDSALRIVASSSSLLPESTGSVAAAALTEIEDKQHGNDAAAADQSAITSRGGASAGQNNNNNNNNSISRTTIRRRRRSRRRPCKYKILCDMGYGVPREARPRKEKIRAIARQLVNFLSWQQQQQQQSSPLRTDKTVNDDLVQDSPLGLHPAKVCIVGCTDATIEQMLRDRMLEIWREEEQTDALPKNLTFSHQSLEAFLSKQSERAAEPSSSDDDEKKERTNLNEIVRDTKQEEEEEATVIYLSPDASVALSPADNDKPPPSTVVVGLLIDRKHIQVDRSLQRATALSIPAARWPLEKIVLLDDHQISNDDKNRASCTLDASEPLNVDCIMEGMQQWYWNYEKHQRDELCIDDSSGERTAREACFSDAVLQALQHHVERHPGRPIHKAN